MLCGELRDMWGQRKIVSSLGVRGMRGVENTVRKGSQHIVISQDTDVVRRPEGEKLRNSPES